MFQVEKYCYVLVKAINNVRFNDKVGYLLVSAKLEMF